MGGKGFVLFYMYVMRVQSNGGWYPSTVPFSQTELTQLEIEKIYESHTSYHTRMDLALDAPLTPLNGHILLPNDQTQLCAFEIDCLEHAVTHRKFVVKKGDDISIMYDGTLSYCTVSKIVLVVVNAHHYIYVFQRWWWEGKAGQVRGAPNRPHPIRKTMFVHRSQERAGQIAPPSPAGFIDQQVSVHHNCIRTHADVTRTCRVQSFCTRSTCQRVGEPLNDVCRSTLFVGPCTFIEKDTHECERNKTYEIIDRAVGFIPNHQLK